MSFKKYLQQYLDQDNPYGDFARDVYQDKEFPRKSDYKIIKSHLENCNAMSVVFDIFDKLWDLYQINN